jgi:hypothetical protein
VLLLAFALVQALVWFQVSQGLEVVVGFVELSSAVAYCNAAGLPGNYALKLNPLFSAKKRKKKKKKKNH